MKGKDYALKWKVRLVNNVSPVSAMVSDMGRYVVTFDNWYSVGYGNDVVVVYGEKGKFLYKYRLEDMLSYSDIRNFVESSVSSRWWRKDRWWWPDYIDEEKELLVLFTSAGKRVITLKDGKVQTGEAKKADTKGELSYSSLLERVKKGDKPVDFREFRLAYTKTQDFNPYEDDEDTHRKVFDALDKKEYEKAAAYAKTILEKDYVNIDAHFASKIFYREMKDEERADFHDFIVQGLINSILDSGDGRSPETAYQVIRPREEYIILAVFGLKMKEQSLIESNSHQYDKLKVKDMKTGEASVIYFNVDIPKTWLDKRFK
ncbi:MAG: DUF4919 domain-containing protein [Nitrospirae bacterium]|nr:DUF4919 domain-containing protein [Nitrospirota bacterium]